MQPRRLSQACQRRLFRIFTALAAAPLLYACSSSQQRAADLAVQAQQLIAAGDYAGAGRDLRAAVQIRDDDSAIWLLLGQVEQRNGNLREAFLAYNRANELKPSDPDTLRSIAYTGYLVGARSDAASAADRLLVLSPSDSSALSVKGLMALDERDTKTALSYADNILTTNPGDETGILLKARALAVAGDLKAALALLNETQTRTGPTGGLLTLRLQLERVAGNAAAMKEIYPQLIQMNPKGEDMYVDYANFLYKTGDTNRARKILTDGMLMQRRNGPYLGWAFSVLDRYEPTNVPPQLDPRIVKQPPSLLRSAAARYLLDRGDARGAAALVSPQGSIDANDRGIYAAALDAMGRRAEAEAIVDELLAKPGAQDPEALILRARWTMAANPGRAATAAQAAVIADTTNVRARLLLADIYTAQGDAIRVRQVYREAANDLPGNRRVLDALLAFLQRSGDKDGMVGAIRTFADANRSDAWAWGMLADLCKQMGNTSCADTARFRQKNALADFSSPNPNRPNLERGLFSALNRPT